MYYDVYYLDAIGGGSGRERMKLENVPAWLDAHPGVLIRKLVNINIL